MAKRFGRVEELERRVLMSVYAPDVSFGAGGVSSVVGGNVLLDGQSNGKILAVGTHELLPKDIDDMSFQTIATRLKSNGTRDKTFNNIVLDDRYIAAEAGSKLFLAVITGNELRIYNTADGSLDTSFGDNGVGGVPFSVPKHSTSVDPITRTIQSTTDGGVLVETLVQYNASGTTFTQNHQLVKLKADGSLDTSFGVGGFVTFPDVAQSPQQAYKWTSHGLLVLSFVSTGTQITRYETDGKTIDTTFGTQGTVTLSPVAGGGLRPHETIYEQADGKLLVVTSGTETGQAAGASTVRISRLNVNGTHDSAFGNSGSIVLNNQSLDGLTFDAQQDIVVATDQSLYAYNSAGVPGPSPFNGTLPAGEVTGLLDVDSAGRLLTGGSTTVTRFDTGAEVALSRDNVVYVRGTDAAADQVAIHAPSKTRINVSLNGQLMQFAASDVLGFNLDLHDGNNVVSSTIDLPTTVATGNGADKIVTAGGDDSISSTGGADHITTGAGDDSIRITGGGNRVFNLGDGNDNLQIINDDGSASDQLTVTGGNGNKTIKADLGGLNINLGVGNSNITTSGHGTDHIAIVGGNNTVVLNATGDMLSIGGDGNNTVEIGGNGADVTTGDGNDTFNIFTSATIHSNGGDDLFNVKAAFDNQPLTIFAGDGNDTLSIAQDTTYTYPTVFNGENGDDFAQGSNGSQTLNGNAGKDTLHGGGSSDLLSGGGGNDTIYGENGNDRLYGGNGRDRVYGGSGDDRLFGGASGDWLYSQGGNDQLNGDGGDDRLFSDYSTGNATLHGNAGDDSFVTTNDLVDHLFGDGGTDSAIADKIDVLSSIEAIM